MFAAKVEDGVVTQVVITDAPPDGWIASSTRVSVGWVYDGAVFSTKEAGVSAAEARDAMSVSPMQIRLALAQIGLLDSVNAHVAGDAQAAIAWEYATRVERNSPFVAGLALTFIDPSTGEVITEQAVDDLFALAATL